MTMGRELSLCSQMVLLASFRDVPSGAVIIFSRGVMNARTGVSGAMRLTR